MTSLRANKQAWRGEVQLLAADGDGRPLLVRADPVLSTPDRVLGFVLLFTDLTERKAADVARRAFQDGIVHSNRRLTSRIDSAADLRFQSLMSSDRRERATGGAGNHGRLRSERHAGAAGKRARFGRPRGGGARATRARGSPGASPQAREARIEMTQTHSMRSRLREATLVAHERMHGHDGFAAAAAGAISISDYRWLLRRLYGFHRAFELSLAQMACDPSLDVEARARSALIADDLQALGLDAVEIPALPLCPDLTPPRDAAEALGALYVVEGSTLGGVQIARALQAVVAEPNGRGRRFYLGYGDRHGAMWRAFLERLESLADRPRDAAAAMRSAVSAFERFEAWMRDWKPAFAGPADLS